MVSSVAGYIRKDQNNIREEVNISNLNTKILRSRSQQKHVIPLMGVEWSISGHEFKI
jgi:hypothetical protein